MLQRVATCRRSQEAIIWEDKDKATVGNFIISDNMAPLNDRLQQITLNDPKDERGAPTSGEAPEHTQTQGGDMAH